jgi:hypothetical protein
MRLARSTLCILLFATTARGQGDPSLPVAPVPPIVTPLHMGPLGDVGGAGNGRTDLAPMLSIAPLRLTLMSDLVPMGQLFQGCGPLGDPSGNSIQGFPLLRAAFFAPDPCADAPRVLFGRLPDRRSSRGWRYPDDSPSNRPVARRECRDGCAASHRRAQARMGREYGGDRSREATRQRERVVDGGRGCVAGPAGGAASIRRRVLTGG